MKTYTVENDEGRQVTFEWDDDNNPPTDSDMEEVFAASKIDVINQEQISPESKPKTDRNLFSLPDNVEKAIFPTSGTQATGKREKGLGGSIKQGAMAGLDVLSLPSRALGTLRKNPETGNKYKLSDVESSLLRPEINKIKSNIDKSQVPKITTDKTGKAPAFNPMGSFSFVSGDNGNKAILKGATEIAGGVAGDPTVLLGGTAGKIASKALTKVGSKSNSALGKLAQELSGVSEETLRKVGTGFGKGAQELKNAAGSQKQIGEKLLDALDNFDQYLPEKQVIENAVQNMPDVNIANTINKLNSSKTTGHLKGTQQINTEIDNLVAELSAIADPAGNIPAQKFIEVRREIDDVIGDQFGKSTNKFIGAAKQARYQMAQDLVEAAKNSGNEEYVTAMKSFSDKLKLVDDLKGYVGKSSQARDKRIETFISTLFGKNKSDRQRVVDGLGNVFGEDFLKESKLASMAAELGEEGTAGLLPRQFTGRSALGATLSGGGLAVGLGPASLAPLALSSPRIAAGTLAASNSLGKGLNYSGNLLNSGIKTIKKLPGLSSATQNLMLQNKRKELK